MIVSLGSIIVLDSVTLNAVVRVRPFKVTKVMSKSFEATPLDYDGRILDTDRNQFFNNRQIVAVLDKVEDFTPFRKMNDEINEKYKDYQNLLTSMHSRVKAIQSSEQKKIIIKKNVF